VIGVLKPSDPGENFFRPTSAAVLAECNQVERSLTEGDDDGSISLIL
jgi:hypothetical protein